jgi:hypothetical protein
MPAAIEEYFARLRQMGDPEILDTLARLSAVVEHSYDAWDKGGFSVALEEAQRRRLMPRGLFSQEALDAALEAGR